MRFLPPFLSAPVLSVLVLFAITLRGQNGAVPLESVTIEGSAASRAAVLAVAGLDLGTPVDKAGIEAACKKLQESGLFDSINYRYAPGPKGGVALTLALADPRTLIAASIDVPGTDEKEAWDWVKAQFPSFDHKIPVDQGAQEYLAKAIAQHLGAKLRGQRLVTRMEDDFAAKRGLISFQPETLPRVTALLFTGQHEIPAEKLNAILSKYAQNQGYTDRGFRELVELNLRPAYEDRGMYRVKFPSISASFAEAGSVSVTTSIEEGPQYKLSAVIVSGDAPSPDELLQAAGFKKGELANWTEMQSGIYAFDRPLQKRGYLQEKVSVARSFDDEQHLLSLNIKVAKGPLFHFGTVRFQGLAPDVEVKARSIWTMKTGDIFDPFYSNVFVAELSRKTDLRKFTKTNIKNEAGVGDHVMNVVVTFE